MFSDNFLWTTVAFTATRPAVQLWLQFTSIWVLLLPFQPVISVKTCEEKERTYDVTKSPRTHMRNIPDDNSRCTKLYRQHYAFRQVKFTWLPPTLIHESARWCSTIYHARRCISTAPESNGGKLYSPPAEPWHYAQTSQAWVWLLSHGMPSC